MAHALALSHGVPGSATETCKCAKQHKEKKHRLRCMAAGVQMSVIR